MKNLSSIPRLSLFEVFTILITLAVCLAAFTEAEVRTNLRKHADKNYKLKEAPTRENVPYSYKTVKLRGGELQQPNLEKINNLLGGSLEKLTKRQSEDFGESADSETEKENDGYGYDDDEYYHLNYKRNNDAIGSLDGNKMNKGVVGEPNKKEGISAPFGTKFGGNGKSQKENNEKESQTIEMLNFKEFHPNVGGEVPNQSPVQNSKPFIHENTHKKLPASSLDSLNMRDLKENSAIDEKLKKEEGAGVLAAGSSESKTAEGKKNIKAEDKEVKLKDTKIAEDPEKKEKEPSLKDVKENVANKNLKDTAKGSEEKEKNLKLSDSAKLQDNLEKLNVKNKDSETAKIAKEDKDSASLIGKGNEDIFNPSDISQISSRANFVSNDYKDNLEAMKPAEGLDDEKDSEEFGEGEKNVGLTDYGKLRERNEKLKERQLSIRDNAQGNAQDSRVESPQGASKENDYLSIPVNIEIKDESESDYFKKRASWKDHGKFHFQPEQIPQMQQEQQPTQDQQQPQMAYERDFKNSYHLKFPPGEIENTEYHKNFLKSLKRYKNLNENLKVLNSESPSSSNSGEKTTTFHEGPETRKKKRSKPKKRRSMPPNDEDKSETTHSKTRRNTYRTENRWFPTQRQDSQMYLTKTGKDESKIFENKKYDGLQEPSRQRRKSPAKFEYEIKIINQNQPESRNAALSSLRSKKNAKTKLSTDDKYLKKYPFSQVKRDDLIGMESEKKYKRKAPVWMKKDQNKESVIQTRGLPSGYYGNRVKFGQKSYTRTEDKSNSEQTASDLNKMTYAQTPLEKSSSFQRTWEFKPQDFKHDPTKRYDASNSLLLIKKDQNGERIAKTFEEGTSKDMEEKVDTEHLAKLLSKDTDYLILKKTDSNKYQKVSEPEEGMNKQGDNSPTFQVKKDDLESEPQEKLSLKNKAVFTRSSSHKEEKKYPASLHPPSSKSNLKKTFEKFRDLADFFKENEPETVDNQFQTQEVKEGRDIVFSEDKLPDPIVINNDPNKSDNLGQKPTNSIYSISNNFKHLDQQDRKEEERKEGDLNKNMLTAEMKSDTQDFPWEPALKNAFPEAKSINSMSKNGNEIIVLDFNRNQLKNEHGFLPVGKTNSKSQPLAGGSVPTLFPNSRLLNPVGQRQVEVVLPSKLTLFDKNRDDEKSSEFANGPYAVFKGSDGQTQVSIPLNQLNQLGQIPGLFKTYSTKKQNFYEVKSVKKKSPKTPQDSGSENYNQFLRDLRELSEVNKKGKLALKRNTKDVYLPASNFPELTGYSDVNFKNLGTLLANILTSQNANRENSNENLKPGYFKTEQQYPIAYDTRRQNQWSSETKNNDHAIISNKEDTIQTEGMNEMDKVLQTGGENKKYQEETREDILGGSSRIQRLRREGKRKLRKTMEDTMPFKDSEKGTDKCPVQADNKCMIKLGSDTSASKETSDSKLRDDDENKENVEHSKSLKSDYEDHLSELFENLSSNKNQKDQLNIPNESTPIRGKRKGIVRRKRSSRRDVKNNVSTTEVQNRILKNLPEDNYPSVYSPGIKRKLLSTENGAEDADGYYGADEHDGSEMAEEVQENCAKNVRNKCIDPIILELFGEEGAAGEKNRDRRSLSAGFHSNFKREIDLDESMPNDFQNFLVTSLGGFGSQKREVVKKDEALWESKDNSQENYNQIVENSPAGKDTSEDSALEKREVPSGDNRKLEKYKSSNFFGPRAESDKKTVSRSEKITRSEDKSLGAKVSEYDDKVPTRIRIQITNASGKEKKSSKPIMDESEPTSTEMENLPKEKEFFDKNKANQLGLNPLPKLHQFSKPKFTLPDYDDVSNGDDKQKPYAPRPYRRRRRKKKKYITENPMKPIKDFIAFDQKAMEILLRKYMNDQNMANDQHGTTQKVPMSNHLPQVETVYNPTQGTNKAQIDSSRITKINSISNKNAENAKNSLQTNEASTFEEGILRSYLKDKASKTKTEKAFGKEYEDPEWKSYSGKPRIRADSLHDNSNDPSFQNFKNFAGDTASYSTNAGSNPENHFFQSQYSQKWQQNPYSNYFYHSPDTNIMNSNSFYDALKLKQELKNYGFSKGFKTKDHPSKSLQKPYYYTEGSLYYKTDDKDRNYNLPTTVEPTWNTYDYTFNKKPFAQNLKSVDFYNPAIKNQMDSRTKVTYPSTRNKYSKSVDNEKLFDSAQSHGMDNSKEPDYMDTLEEDYIDDDAGKEMQFDEPIMADDLKKPSKIYDPSNFHRMYSYKNSDLEDGISDTDEEFDDEYDETADDEDIDDYPVMANMRDADLKLPKSSHLVAGNIGSYRSEDALSHLSTFLPKSNQYELKGTNFEQTEYNQKADDKFEPGRQSMPLVDMKNNLEPISGSTNILKKANENSNIFGKNLMKNLNKYSYDESWRSPEKLRDDQPSVDLYPKFGRKIRKTKIDRHKKLKRKQAYPQIGNRIFYVARSQLPDRSVNLRGNIPGIARRLDQHKRIALMAQFAAADNEFENDFDNEGKHINGINDHEDLEEVKENLEDNGETISEDNVLENIIGKYIMRKKAQSSPSEISESEKKLQKRSTKPEKPHKFLKKRLSSGHLTENNYKKFHKKNFLAKRHTDKENTTPKHILRREDDIQKCAPHEQTVQNEEKRSALDIFKKITNKDRDKKIDNSESRSAGFEPLLTLSDKKPVNPSRNSEEASAPQTKKLNIQEKPGSKLYYTGEPLNMKDSVSERKKEKSKVSLKAAEGPWKLDLNDSNKWDHPEGDKSLVESGHGKDNKDLQAYFVIRKNVNRAKRKFQGAFSTAGSSQTEVGTSYRPRFEEGKEHIRKRSLEPSMVREKGAHEDGTQASLKKPITESLLAIQQHNRALHDTQSLSEGDSDPQVPHMLQSNFNINGSFVTDNDANPWFLSNRKLTNLKSVFPPLTDENIIRDSRDINEGKSEYIGQRIVEAILSQVSANAKFKDLIAPGLVKRTPVPMAGIDEEKETLHQMDFNEQLQSFLQKFMFDLQKLAEKHVKKRMCNEIDKQSKKFLQSLINVPVKRSNCEIDNSETSCSSSDDLINLAPTMTNTLLGNEPPVPSQQPSQIQREIITSLKKKQELLKKLISEYQSLSKLEQETLKVNYRYLLHELEQTNRQILLPQRHSYIFQNPDLREALCLAKSNKLEKSKKDKSFENVTNCCPPQNQQSIPETPFRENTPFGTIRFSLPSYVFSPERTTPSGQLNMAMTESSATTTPPPPSSPIYYFDPLGELTEKPPLGTFETVESVNSSEPNTYMNSADSNTNLSYNPFSTSAPQSFDLFSMVSPMTPTEVNSGSESFRIKQSALKNNDAQTGNIRETSTPQNSEYEKLKEQSALNALSSGDAAGLQLSIKSRDPWVSTLDFAKTFRNVPSNFLQHSRERLVDYQDAYPTMSFKRARSLIVPEKEFNPFVKYYNNPVFPYRLDKKFYTPKVRPFFRVSEPNEKPKEENCQVLPFQYFLRKGNFPTKQRPVTHGLNPKKIKFKRKKKKKKRTSKRHGRRFANSGENDHKNTEHQERSPKSAAVDEQRL